MRALLATTLLLVIILNEANAIVWPHPKQITYGTETKRISACHIQKPNNLLPHFLAKLEASFSHLFKGISPESCDLSLIKDHLVPIFINVTDTQLRAPHPEQNEHYQLSMNHLMIHIKAETYVGFLRAIETLAQLVQPDPSNKGFFLMENLPIEISDEPAFSYRGLMIDTARHYLSKKAILRVIDGMMTNQLNVLHWHITDDESFPLFLSTYPNITYNGAFTQNQTYSVQDVQEIVAHATASGVRIIPEIDSPGHCRSWGLTPELKDMVILCPGGEHYNHQLDPTMDLTYQVNSWIWNDIQNLFPDSYVHMGGDEVFGSCWDQRPSIKQFMNKNNISDYKELQMYYRSRQKQSLKKGKTAVYWANEDIHFSPDPNDVIQFWGKYNTTNIMLDTNSKLIMSSVDYLYINTGFGFIWGNPFGVSITWKDIYGFNPIPPGFTKERILGAEATLWGEVSNQYTLDNYLWPRASSFAERVWNPVNDTMANVASRLVAMVKILTAKGFNPSPVTTQYCENHITECFKN